jgi:hypothetical protein
MESKDIVMNENDLKTHALEMSEQANEDLVRLNLWYRSVLGYRS